MPRMDTINTNHKVTLTCTYFTDVSMLSYVREISTDTIIDRALKEIWMYIHTITVTTRHGENMCVGLLPCIFEKSHSEASQCALVRSEFNRHDRYSIQGIDSFGVVCAI